MSIANNIKNFIPVSDSLSTYIIFRDNHNWGRYILKDLNSSKIIEIVEVGAEPIPVVSLKEVQRESDRDCYTKMFCEIICNYMADRKRYVEIKPEIIGEPLLSKIAELVKNYKPNNDEKN